MFFEFLRARVGSAFQQGDRFWSQANRAREHARGEDGGALLRGGRDAQSRRGGRRRGGRRVPVGRRRGGVRARCATVRWFDAVQDLQGFREAGLLCGKDGLPHLIVDGNTEHLGEFAVPGLGFLYVAGWIGYAGRSYVQMNKNTAKPTEGEIIIDVPAALGVMFQAGAWPLLAGLELKNGTLTAPESEITVSPR